MTPEEYHQATKHHFHRYARGPGRLDWATQPEPFRRYQGAPLLPLPHPLDDEGPSYAAALSRDGVAGQAVSRRTVSALFYDSLALSAWKRAGGTAWALRVNPSSGNLHPTEGYLLCGPVEGLADTPIVAHYAPREHALEMRASVPPEAWLALVRGLPAGTLLVGLASIHWREAWKYGERAFRYCQLDAGHAIAAVALAAAGRGWQARVLDDAGTGQVARLLGVDWQHEAEREEADCLLAIYPRGSDRESAHFVADAVEGWGDLDWHGTPNRLSRGHVAWPLIDEVAANTEKLPTRAVYDREAVGIEVGMAMPDLPLPETNSLRRIVRQRRSAVAMDPRGSIDRDAFYRIVAATAPVTGCAPLDALPWPPMAHLILFVHRVEGLAPGLYCLVRDAAQERALRAGMRPEFDWAMPDACPAGLPLYRLLSGDARAAARQLSCHQEIAADGVFAVAMLARFDDPLARYGPWFYRRLYWECGVIGQVLYLEAEAAGVRGTGIGCFFDDPTHELLGLETRAYQSLYHFAVGRPVEDGRLTTLPAYPAR